MDEGMYGCIFTPSLLCKNKKDQPLPANTSYLSKLIGVDSAELEYSIATIIRGIPLWKNYFSVATSICEPSLKQTDEDISKCEIIGSKSLSTFRILSMTYGGSPLHNFNFKTFHKPCKTNVFWKSTLQKQHNTHEFWKTTFQKPFKT